MRDSDIAYQKLRMMIVTTELKPGELLVESKLMERLHVGRTPIREALNRLSWENFVKIIPRQCIMVNEIPLHEVGDISQIRLALSRLESELAAARRTDGDLERLEQNIQELGRETDQKKRVLLDRDFHRIISSMTKNSFLEQEMNNFQDLSIRLLFYNQESLGTIDNLRIDEHEEMFRCLKERNSEKLIQLQQEHIIGFRNKFIGKEM